MFLFVGDDNLRKDSQLYGGWSRRRGCFLHYRQKLFDLLARVFVLQLADMHPVAELLWVEQSLILNRGATPAPSCAGTNRPRIKAQVLSPGNRKR